MIFGFLRNVLKGLSYCWCVLGICRCKDFTAETIPKNIKGVARMLYLFWKWSREKKLREFSSIRCLTFVIPTVSQLLQKTGRGALFILINEFCNRGRDRKWSFDTIFLSNKVSDQIFAISLIKGSSIFSLSISFLLRFPNSKKWLADSSVPSKRSVVSSAYWLTLTSVL